MNNYDNFSERIEQLIAKLGGPSEFARKAGVTLPTVARWRKNEADPSRTNLVRIAEAANVNLEWLATGRNVAYSGENDKTQEHDEIAMIAGFSDVYVSAGYGGWNEDVTQPDCEVPYSISLLESLWLKPDDAIVLWARGDSMLPTIDDNDQLLVDTTKTTIRSNKVYVVHNKGEMWVKRVKKEWDKVVLISDNEEYQPIEIAEDEAEHLQIVGQVVHVGHSLA